MRALLFFVFLAVSACAAQQLQPLPAANETDSQAGDSDGTVTASTAGPSASEGQEQQQEAVTARPHVGGIGGAPRPPHNRQPGLYFPGFNPGFGQGFFPGFIPGFNPGRFPGFMPRLPFPGFGR